MTKASSYLLLVESCNWQIVLADILGSLLCRKLYCREYYSLSNRECVSATESPPCNHQYFRQTVRKSPVSGLFRRLHELFYTAACFADAAWCCDFARFLIPRPAWTDAFTAVESMLSSAFLLDAVHISKIFFRVLSSLQRQKQLYTVWCGPNLAGRSLQRAPLRASHMIPFRCARITFWGRPICDIGMIGWISSHSLSVSS